MILSRLKREMHLSSRSKAIRMALRAALREIEYERIRRAYRAAPENAQEIRETESLVRMSTRGMGKEPW